MRGLDDKDRELLVLMLEGQNLLSISQRLGVQYSTAGVRLHRLRHKIRNLLSSQEKK
jgi:DNA-directed RNA polymerase specialized sigma24 family protein